jgi:DNA repair protein RadA/Sms
VPKANAPKTKIAGLEIIAVDRIDQAIAAARNLD